ncbi:hypothetical protein K469DRAFT_606310, partial [Zopfia rhizophila CBS 207.26]
KTTIYKHLCLIQGINMPVYLDNIKLETFYFYKSIIELVYIIFLSFKGKLISKYLTTKNRLYVT